MIALLSKCRNCPVAWPTGKLTPKQSRTSKLSSMNGSKPRANSVAQFPSRAENSPMLKSDPRDYETRIWYSAEKGDECFIAQVVEWPGIMAHGDTREEAARQIQVALEGALEVAAERGIKPPAPALAHAS